MFVCSSLSVPKCEGRDENKREPSLSCMMGDQTLHIKNTARTCPSIISVCPKHYHKEQCLMTTFLSTSYELPFVDVEEYEAAVVVMPHSKNSIKRTPFRSQNTADIHFLMNKVCLNLFGSFEEWECIHYLDCSFVSWFSKWTHVSFPVTILLKNLLPLSW